MEKLKKLLSKCKCGVHFTINEHRNYYQSAEEKLEELAHFECPPNILEEIKLKMIEIDTIIEIQFYPDTPIGFFSIYHWDLNKAIDLALQCFDGE